MICLFPLFRWLPFWPKMSYLENNRWAVQTNDSCFMALSKHYQGNSLFKRHLNKAEEQYFSPSVPLHWTLANDMSVFSPLYLSLISLFLSFPPFCLCLVVYSSHIVCQLLQQTVLRDLRDTRIAVKHEGWHFNPPSRLTFLLELYFQTPLEHWTCCSIQCVQSHCTDWLFYSWNTLHRRL